MTRSLLDQVCASVGIESAYQDIHGKRRTVPEATRRALLAAMGLAGDPGQVLAAQIEKQWRQVLPPVLVGDEGRAAIVFPVSLPAEFAGRSLQWRMSLEDGRRQVGQLDLGTEGEQRSFGEASFLRRDASIELDLPPGYHQLQLFDDAGEPIAASMQLIIAPATCHTPDALKGNGRVWGPTVQLPGLRSRRNWGMGDFTDLVRLIEYTASEDADIVGVSPLHALFSDDSGRVSPYSPSSRLFLNTLFIDVEAIAELNECGEALARISNPAFRAELARAREAELVDYPRVARAKDEILRLLWRHFTDNHLSSNSPRAMEYRRFVDNGGERLRRHALHQALREHLRGDSPHPVPWQAWPEAFRNPDNPAVSDFAQSHADEIGYHQYLQWIADSQLHQAGIRSWQLGLGVGLYQDLAVGVADDGSEAWSHQALFAFAARIGSPPDDFSIEGQDWGLVPYIPHVLRELAYAPLIASLRAVMRHAGALRIDHVMGLTRLFWVPLGASASHGGYVQYPLDDLLAIVALESRRNQCLVIGEDLGTVPRGLRPLLAGRGLLSYRPLWFQRNREGGFAAPDQYPRDALVAASTHDMATLAGFWQGHDLDIRAVLGMFPDDAIREEQLISRAQDRARLLVALRRESLLPDSAGLHPVSVPIFTTELAIAIHAYLARSAAKIFLVQPEDAFGVVEQVNLPGTFNEHPNWRRKLPEELDQWHADSRLSGLAAAIRTERPLPPRRQVAHPAAAPGVVIPRATYRLQLNRDFTFAQATAIVPYLARLGISHCYCSPFLRARPGSTHGYDVVDHNAFNPEIGSAEEFETFALAARQHGLGLILDVVPNHMGVMGADNAWWLDVLENGQASRFAGFFDIDWEPLKAELSGKVLLPILGDHYGEILARGEIRLAFEPGLGEFSLYYWQHRLPVDPAEYPRIVGSKLRELEKLMAPGAFAEFQNIAAAFGHLPSRRDVTPERVAERSRDAPIHKRRLAALCAEEPGLAAHIESRVAWLNGEAGDPASFDALHELIKAQAYRLAYWRVAADDINYRRFFDINDLAALRMENEEVFRATHGLILDLVARGHADGLRIDHPDGLFDPGAYFRRLQSAAAKARGTTVDEAVSVYLLVEKILADHEDLREDWPLHGTSGYRFANVVSGLFIDTNNARKLSRIYADFIGTTHDFDEMVYQAKRLIMKTALASELGVLAAELSRIAALDRHTCDYTLNALRDALREVVACFPVYRTYVAAGELAPADRRHIDWAMARAKKRSQAADVSVFDFLHGVLTGEIARGKSSEYGERVVRCAQRVQQFTSPVMAKGVEDTSFYRYHRLVSLNEVGGDPRTFGFTLAAFHAANRDRARRWPHTMLATSTHDTKRSEDVRARIDVLSEIPAAWKLTVRRWSRINRSRKQLVDEVAAPDRDDEYLLYQTLLGTWPLNGAQGAALAEYCSRIERYMLKAVREAKLHSSWINPNAAYENALVGFIRALLAPGERNLFLADFAPAARRVSRLGLYNSLAQTLIKATAPGVPDFYQGNEMWQFCLVDPDNRQAIDYELRRAAVNTLADRCKVPEHELDRLPAELLAQADTSDAAIKLYVTWRALNLRRERPELFADGDYVPLDTIGMHSEQVCAFARTLTDQYAITAVGRFFTRFDANADGPPPAADWGDTRLEMPLACEWRDSLTGRLLRPHQQGSKSWLAVSDVFSVLPFALLTPA